MNNIKRIIMTLSMILISLAFITGCSSKTKQEDPKKESNEIKTLSTKELQEKISDSDWVIVDARSNDAFNGWKLDEAKSGGHIKGATDFSANWIKVDKKDKDKELKEVMNIKGITKEKNIVLYDVNEKDANEVANYFKKNGIDKLYTYNLKEDSKDELKLESYENYQLLVPPSWIEDVISDKKPENFKGGSYKIFEVSWGNEAKDYKKGHIKGAVHINTDEVEEGPIWNRLSDDKLEKFALNNGIDIDTTVILYGEDPMGSFRLAAILKYMGVKDVRVLNGGFAAWRNSGYAIETKENSKTEITSFGATVPVNKDYIVDMPKAKEILSDKEKSKLVDIRTLDEHIGKIPGYPDITAKGRPSGAVWGHAGSDSQHLEEFRNIDNTMRNSSEILSMWKAEGITPDQRLSFFCGTGWRAAEVQIYAETMGIKNSSIYDGGWYEWSSDPENPVETGK